MTPTLLLLGLDIGAWVLLWTFIAIIVGLIWALWIRQKGIVELERKL